MWMTFSESSAALMFGFGKRSRFSVILPTLMAPFGQNWTQLRQPMQLVPKLGLPRAIWMLPRGQILTQVPQPMQLPFAANFFERAACMPEKPLLSSAKKAFFGGFFSLRFVALTAAATSAAVMLRRSWALSLLVGGKVSVWGISQMQVEWLEIVFQ